MTTTKTTLEPPLLQEHHLHHHNNNNEYSSSPLPPQQQQSKPPYSITTAPSYESIELIEEARQQPEQLRHRTHHHVLHHHSNEAVYSPKTTTTTTTTTTPVVVVTTAAAIGGGVGLLNNNDNHTDNDGGDGGNHDNHDHQHQHQNYSTHSNHHHQHHNTTTTSSSTTTKKSFISFLVPIYYRIVPQSTNNPQPNDILLQVGIHQQQQHPHHQDQHPKRYQYCWELSRRQVGIALAVFNGCWGGSIMVPMKFCPDPTITNGIGYVWSFSIGAMIVTTILWLIRYMWSVLNLLSPSMSSSSSSSSRSSNSVLVVLPTALAQAYESLPSFHWNEMLLPGGLSGLLWSVGNLFSILSVDSLGEGVGYCVCQASMLVSGLWGIFYFKEVKGADIISKWFLSALLTVSGILLLSYEHQQES